MTERRQHAVRLGNRHVGVLHHWEDVVRFTFSPDYWIDPDRSVLGLWFEDHPRASPQAALRLPTWFSNLLPEGRLREWVAKDRGVSTAREMELLLRLGRDLAGSVEIVEDAGEPDSSAFSGVADARRKHVTDDASWKFSLAGVGMKFSMLQVGDRLTVPGHTSVGDWIVKLPDSRHPNVPLNEHVMMTLAARVGIDVPEHRLVDRDDLPELPGVAWPSNERLAYAITRFDRTMLTGRVHIEDFCQIRGFYPEQKYDGTFETVGALSYRGNDIESLQEFTRRLVFNILVGNGDAHLKNWSLIYPDGRRGRLSPAYDIVSTAPYLTNDSHEENLGLKFGGSRNFSSVRLHSFLRLEEKLAAKEADLRGVVEDTVKNFNVAFDAIDRSDSDLDFALDWIDERRHHMSRQITDTRA